MNRKEEYEAMLKQLSETPPALEGTVARARAKGVRRRFLRPCGSVAAVFAAFVLAVNFITPVADACSNIPVLKELAKAVTFSRSLTDAVDNEYVQPLNLEQTKDGVTAKIEYLIVDQKQVNVFYRLDSNAYDMLTAMLTPKTDYSWHSTSNSYDVPNGELQSTTIDFTDGDVPGALEIRMEIYPREDADKILTSFDFTLEFDPYFTAAGKTIEASETFTVDDQKLTLDTVEIYPTHLRFNISADPDNSAWLMGLKYYILVNGKEKFESPKNAITATGSGDDPGFNSFRTDSTWFYNAKTLQICITGADWRSKGKDGKVRIDLKKGAAGKLPEGVRFEGAKKTEEGWEIRFSAPYEKGGHTYQLFEGGYLTPDGQRCQVDRWGYLNQDPDSDDGQPGRRFISYNVLQDYPYDTVTMIPQFTHRWRSAEPVVIRVK